MTGSVDICRYLDLPFCGACRGIKEAYQQAADHFAETRSDVVLAEIDISLNEVELYNTDQVPEVILVTKGDNKVNNLKKYYIFHMNILLAVTLF